jgi:hypothetical protein
MECLYPFDQDFLFCADPVLRVNETFNLGFSLDPVQEKIIQDTSTRIIVNCTRQWGKTTTVAAKAAAEALAMDKPGLILIVAPVERQARELFRKIRTSLRYALGTSEKWPEDNKTSLELPNGARIVAVPAKGENIRGYTNPYLIIMDEAAFIPDEDYRSVRPMLSHGARLILMSTPFGKRGFFYETWKHQDKRWNKYSVTAEQCSHIGADFLDEERIALGPIWYRQEYCCEFLDNVNSYFDMDAVRLALEDELDPLWPVRGDGGADYVDQSIQPLFGGQP